jgi:SPP1 family predicted phage head-tail adaptor
MRAGSLNRRVTIQQPDGTQDAIGQPGGWSTLAVVWADVAYLNGMETVRADAPTSIAKASIRIRRRTDVTPQMRAVLGSTTFQIIAVLPDEEGKEFVDLACQVIA